MLLLPISRPVSLMSKIPVVMFPTESGLAFLKLMFVVRASTVGAGRPI